MVTQEGQGRGSASGRRLCRWEVVPGGDGGQEEGGGGRGLGGGAGYRSQDAGIVFLFIASHSVQTNKLLVLSLSSLSFLPHFSLLS